jgi:hypothetical protein
MAKNEKIVELYKKVQKIPYYYLEERDPGLLLKKNKGSCYEKHLYLGKEFEKLGILVKYLLIKFDWNDLPIPKEIIQKRDSPIGWHLALKAKIKQKWIYVDATWDPELEAIGFPVTKKWDGKSDTKLAVSPKEIIEFEKPPRKSKKLKNQEFFDALNEWLEFQRKKIRKS